MFLEQYQCCEHGGECPTGPDECAPWKQDCPEGEKCAPYITTPGVPCIDNAKCMPVIGDRQLDELCEREGDNDDCAVGLFCATALGGTPGIGVCVALCDLNDLDTCADFGHPGGSCICSGNCYDPFCQDSCDPLGTDCPDGRACYISRPACYEGLACDIPVHGADDGYDGDPCNISRQCRPGLTCTDANELADCDAERCCTPLCDCKAADPPECTSPEEACTCLWDSENPPFDRLGVCRL